MAGRRRIRVPVKKRDRPRAVELAEPPLAEVPPGVRSALKGLDHLLVDIDDVLGRHRAA